MLDVYLKKIEIDDRDSYINKRISTPGVLMANLFRQYWSKVVKDIKTQINKKGEDMKGKFGRVLGDFVTDDGRMVTDILVEEEQKFSGLE